MKSFFFRACCNLVINTYYKLKLSNLLKAVSPPVSLLSEVGS